VGKTLVQHVVKLGTLRETKAGKNVKHNFLFETCIM